MLTLLPYRLLEPDKVTHTDVEAWQDLEAVAVEANIYQSPHFVLPAMRHLDPDQNARVLLVSAPEARALAGAAVLVHRRASPSLPLPHVEVYMSRHSFLGAPLLARGLEGRAAATVVAAARFHWPTTPLLVLRRIDAGGAVAGAFMHAMAQRGLGLQAGQRSRRAVLRPASAGAQALKAGSKRRAAELRRCRRRLTEVGVLDWLLIDEGALTEAADNFLRLEHLGWKGDARTSLRSKAGDTAFFQACIRGLAAQNQVWFTELRLNGQAIASTCNFRSGGAGFAFKVGWDPTWRRYGPGWLNEAALVEAAPQACADMAYIDSGATAGSFIDELWPERRELVDLQLPLSMYGDLALRSLGLLRRLKRRLVPDLTPAPEARRTTSGCLEDVR